MARTTTKASLLEKAPALAAQWHPTKNGSLTPADVTPGSNKKVWWECPNNREHIWPATVSNRNNLGRGCPYCSGRYATPEDNLAKAKPDLAAQWHPTKNGTRSLKEVKPQSNKKVWWQCPKNTEHVWQARIDHRFAGIGCPHCQGQRATNLVNLKRLYPDIAAEWHPDKNGKKKPENYRPGSNTRIWWRCKRHPDHEWETTINPRVHAESGCPFCTKQTSLLEVRVYVELRKLFPSTSWREKIYENECDIYLMESNVAIEIDGYYWHKDRIGQDIGKTNKWLDKGINVVRIREKGLDPVTPNDIISKHGEHWPVIDRLCRTLIELISDPDSRQVLINYRASKKFVNEVEYRRIVSCLPGPTPENSIDETHPEIAASWCDSLNAPLRSNMFSRGSHFPAWWVCPDNSNHTWQAIIKNRTKGHGCPFCYGGMASHENNLAVRFPEIAAQWHPERNGKTKPSDYRPYSHKKVWWLCSANPDHEWQTAIAQRTNLKSGCPTCARNRRP